MVDPCLIPIPEAELQRHSLPEGFTYPFFYTPHPLTKWAAEDLQRYLTHQTDFFHNFGLESDAAGLPIGKMFGVLLVQTPQLQVGYLAAFSGKLANSNQHERFVPPVFDMLTEDSFFRREEVLINQLNIRLAELEQDPAYWEAKSQRADLEEACRHDLLQLKDQHRQNKALRQQQREESSLEGVEQEAFLKELARQSVADRRTYDARVKDWKERIAPYQQTIEAFETEMEALKQRRKNDSATLQGQLFDQYVFLNQYQQTKSVGAIFAETVFEKPPAGAGECATPKLLQYAFQKQYRPLAMAEFWWGASPKSELRIHGHYYPACSGKCKPILKHMLVDIPLEPNPMQQTLGQNKQVDIVYQDADLLVVNKPAELLSVPGIVSEDSVYSRLQALLLDEEPIMIHRLDMSTSGLLVVAKNKEAHKRIQKQFIDRTVKKRYTALLSKPIEGESGEIQLPLIGDPLDRPRQKVCLESGKHAVTRWQVVDRTDTYTKVHFWPLTGRTHQLRVHAAHPNGLHAPIVGDDLYGTIDQRLHLHAAFLGFEHPTTGDWMTFQAPDPF